MTTHPARLHVLLARDAPIGVVIRRGPARYVATVLWDRRTDEFSLGQWSHGRIYADRSDLSTDGKYLIYFALNGRWDSEARGAWTAVSRAPYLKALALQPQGDTWSGGGLWTGPDTYAGMGRFRTINGLDGDLLRAAADDGRGQGAPEYHVRLLRDGWAWVGTDSGASWRTGSVLDRPLRHGWVLRKAVHYDVDPPTGKASTWGRTTWSPRPPGS